jgi:hypothetical protein
MGERLVPLDNMSIRGVIQKPDNHLLSMSTNCTTTDWPAIGSMIVALCALVLAIYQGWLARRHNELSVKPDLNAFRSCCNGYFSLVLHNGGLGPGLVDCIYILGDGGVERLSLGSLRSALGEVSSRLTVNSLEGKFSLMPGREVELIRVDRTDGPAPDDELRRANNIVVLIEYQSMYGRKRTLRSPMKVNLRRAK